MDFNERLEKAVQRGQRRSVNQAEQEKARQLSEEEIKRLHTQYRLELSEHIDECLKRLVLHFPGFQHETIYGERGWGAAVSRDDIQIVDGRRMNNYSRLELTIRPLGQYGVLELAGKGAVQNKEVFNRNYFEKIQDVDPSKFIDLIDAWVLEYAELYAARR